MKCMNEHCNNELSGRQKQFCSDKCRMQHKRQSEPEQESKVEQVKPEQSKVEHKPEQGVKSMTRHPLSAAIRAYPQDSWVNSSEHKELMRRLHSMSIDELEADGYWVPAWKRSAVA